MGRAETIVERPQRWESQFGEQMSERDVDRLLRVPPFANMDAERFARTLSLRGILLHDTRIVRYQPGEVVIREGDYGHSAFLVLTGSVRVVLKNLPRKVLGRAETPRKGWLATLWSSVCPGAAPETRRYGRASRGAGAAERSRIFLQDVASVLGPDDTVQLGVGEVFGEMAALSRTPRTATVLAEEPTELLEIRWQGLRDLLRADSAWREHVDQLYRQNSLRVHLRETPLFATMPAESLEAIASATQFASFGRFDWQQNFKNQVGLSPQEQIVSEPLIANEGDYPDGLILIRSGFARLSVRCAEGHRTLAYLGKGDVFGLSEMLRHHRTGELVGWEASLRAVGYVDILRIPTHLVDTVVLPQVPAETLYGLQARAADAGQTTARTGLLEFLVERRLSNGTQAMVIDLDRCTRCDDCLRACAATHEGNPRFNRVGPKHENLMFTQACMHCVDPVCMIGCPTGAIGRDVATGNILINDETCIGCSTCANSCPYQNIKMVEIRDASGALCLDAANVPIAKATKCDLCTGQWGGPACQRACPHDALVRIDLRTPQPMLEWSKA